ncbi:MAG: hypothetical protein P4L81_01770 [Candidatus Pacebacteria bacterium]|nr:hypothetical protein [Candidatus Paceibacterota bacterium]
MYEIGSTMLFPNAEREFGYGEEHFDDTKPEAYNIRLAEYFFSKAAKSDTAIPYLYHELARIAFLNADYQQALVDINLQISLHGDSEPKAYYVRGLIEGYMGLYDAAATDYAHFLTFEPHNWAAKNDEAWVLLKAKRYSEALDVTNSGLADVPANAWLLNSKATALFELGEYKQALDAAQKAYTSVENLTPQEWSIAYPGNDPAIASEGLDVFRKSVVDNMHTIQSAIASSTVQSK